MKRTSARTLKIPKELLEDPQLGKMIAQHGSLDLGSWGRSKKPFESLVRSIVHQQVSGKAAASILKKFVAQFETRFPTPHDVLVISTKKLRRAGLSTQKTTYIKDLALKFTDGTLSPRKFSKMSNEELTEHLTAVKGVGVWTAQMFLIFTLKRPDILPTLDLGIRKGFQVAYRLKELPTHEEMEKRARMWRKHATVASLYLWRIADQHKK